MEQKSQQKKKKKESFPFYNVAINSKLPAAIIWNIGLELKNLSTFWTVHDMDGIIISNMLTNDLY